jgi:hypothetical protein
MNLKGGFVETVWIFYQTLSGRIVPLFLMQVPAAISGATGIDYFLCYAATLAGLEICFAAAIMFLVFRLWPRGSIPQNICVGAAFAATILSQAPSLREMLYWLPGVACYSLPGVITVLVLTEFVRAAENGTTLTPLGTCMMAIGCFVASLCNEFTSAWLLGVVLCSLIIRRIFRNDLQIKEHAIIGSATLIGFAIVLLAPGNGVRMGQFSMAGDFTHSAKEALVYSISNLQRFFGQPATVPWLFLVAVFTLTQPQTGSAPRWNRRLLATLVLMFCLACGYLAYFTHEYATGIRLVTRAQNEVLIFLVSGLTLSTALLARAFRGPILRLIAEVMPGQRNSLTVAAVPVLLTAILILPIYFGKTSKLLRSEQSSFHTFWLESMERNARLTLSTEQDLVVVKHMVFPTALMSEDVTDNPHRLPNDCIAQFYEKNTVVADPQDGAVKTATTTPILSSGP